MLSTDALAVFRKRLREAHLSLNTLSVREGVAAMASFYHDERADDCDIHEDGDMLLVQWGPEAVKGEAASFTVDITRQFMGSEEDADIVQLSLTFTFPPGADLAKFERGERWFESPDVAAGLDEFVAWHNVLEAVAQRTDARVKITFEPT